MRIFAITTTATGRTERSTSCRPSRSAWGCSGGPLHYIPTGYRYSSADGVSRLAITPVGRFSIYRKISGWHHSYLGSMYYPSYFDDGYAIHGDTYVPRYPVSHGCIRIPMWAAVGFYLRNPIGTPVFVVH